MTSKEKVHNGYDDLIKAIVTIGKYDYGKPEKQYPRFVNMQKTDLKFPSNLTIEKGPKAIRAYWNGPALRKREKLKEISN